MIETFSTQNLLNLTEKQLSTLEKDVNDKTNKNPYFKKYENTTKLPEYINKYCYYYESDNKNSHMSKYYENKLISKEFADAFSYVYHYISIIINDIYKTEINKKLFLSILNIANIYNEKAFGDTAENIVSELKQMAFILIFEELIKFKQTNPTFEQFARQTELLLDQKVKMIESVVNYICLNKLSDELKNKLDEVKIQRLQDRLKKIEDKKNRFHIILHYVFYDNRHDEILVDFMDKFTVIKEIAVLKNSPDGFVLGYNYRYFNPQDKSDNHLKHNNLLHIINHFENNGIEIKRFDLMDMNTYYCNNQNPLKSITNQEVMNVIEKSKNISKLQLFDDKYKLNKSFILADLKNFTIKKPLEGETIEANQDKIIANVLGIPIENIYDKNIFNLLCEVSDKSNITSKKFVDTYTYVVFLTIITEIKFFSITHSFMTFKVHKDYNEEQFVEHGRSRIMYDKPKITYKGNEHKPSDSAMCFFEDSSQIIYIIDTENRLSIFNYKSQNPKNVLKEYIKTQFDRMYGELDFYLISLGLNDSARISNFPNEDVIKFNPLLLITNSKKPIPTWVWFVITLVCVSVLILIYISRNKTKLNNKTKIK